MKKHAFAIFIAAASSLNGAAILFSGNFDSTLPLSQMTIEGDIHFTVVKSGNFSIFAFDDWVVCDGSHNSIAAAMNQLSYQINDGTIQNMTITGLVDNFNETAQDLSPNDGYIYGYPAVNVLIGDVVTFKPTTLTFAGTGGFNTPPPAAKKLYLANTFGERMTDITNIPEPGYVVLGLLALPGCALMRKR